MWKCLHFQKPDHELWRWQTVQGLKPINLIQRLVVKLANLSDVRVIGKSWLSAGAENWRLLQDWFARIWLQVNNFLHQRFLYKYQISRKLKQKYLLSYHLLLCWRRKPFQISSSFFQDVFSGFMFLRNLFELIFFNGNKQSWWSINWLNEGSQIPIFYPKFPSAQSPHDIYETISSVCSLRTSQSQTYSSFQAWVSQFIFSWLPIYRGKKKRKVNPVAVTSAVGPWIMATISGS